MIEVPRREDNSKTGKQLESGGKHLIFGGKHLKTSDNKVYFTRKTIFDFIKLLDLAEISLAEEQDMNSEIFNKASSR